MAELTQDQLEVVDEFVDNLDPSRIEDEAERLGMSPDALLDAIIKEARTRIDQR